MLTMPRLLLGKRHVCLSLTPTPRLSLLGLLWHDSIDWVTNWVTLAGAKVKVPAGVWWGHTPWFVYRCLALKGRALVSHSYEGTNLLTTLVTSVKANRLLSCQG